MIQSVDRAMRVLEILEKEGLCSVTEIGDRLEINKSSASRILSTLESRGMVQKDKDTGKYKLGLAILRLGHRLMEDYDLTTITGPYLKELAEITGESAHLSILSGDKVVFLQQSKGTGRIAMMASIGSEEPLHCSAVGKCILAYLPEKEREAMLESIVLEAFTPRTLTSKGMLVEQLKDVKLKGFAIDDEEVYAGIRCIAAPIFNYQERIEASIGVSGPANRIRLEEIPKIGEQVCHIAEQISKELGYKGVATWHQKE